MVRQYEPTPVTLVDYAIQAHAASNLTKVTQNGHTKTVRITTRNATGLYTNWDSTAANNNNKSQK